MEQGRFSGTGSSYDGNDLSGFYINIHSFEHMKRSVGFLYVLGCNQLFILITVYTNTRVGVK
jgi:hypothetical protein